MNTKKEISEITLKEISGGISSVHHLDSQKSKENEMPVIMKDLFKGLSFGPTAPECTIKK